jgi:hypothetical protein
MLVLLGVATAACAPMFMDARPVGKGRGEITPHVSAMGAAFEGESEHLTNNFGIQAIAGLTDRIDVGAGYLRMQPAGGGGGLNLVGFGPKFGVYASDERRIHLAVAAPFGFAFGRNVEVSENFIFSPTFLATFPLSDRVDLTPSARLHIPLNEDDERLLGLNIGVGIGDAARRFRVRPEFGVLFNPGEEGVVWFFGGGVSFRR